jgi:hypothetical protein
VAVLVLRDAARAHGGGVAIVAFAAVFLMRAWPPAEIRAAIGGMDPTARAIVLVAALVVHARLTAGPVRTLVGSRRLALWYALPIARGWWQRTHAIHLLALDLPWLGVIAYAVARSPVDVAIAHAFAAIATTLALQIHGVALADRPRPRVLAIVGIAAITTIAWSLESPWPPVAVAGVLVMIALHRLRDPIAEPTVRTRARRSIADGPVRAWTRLLLRAWIVRYRLVAIVIIAFELVLVAAVALAWRHVGDDEPIAIAWMVRIAAMLGAYVGATAILLAVRGVARDRELVDTLPLPVTVEHRARLGVALVVASPMLLVGVGSPARAVETIVAIAWASTATADLVAGRERARAIAEPVIGRWIGIATLAIAIVILVGHAGALVVWIAIANLRARRRLAAAAIVRARFETTPDDDDHD